MSTLIAVAYGDRPTADAVRSAMLEASRERMIELGSGDVVVIAGDGVGVLGAAGVDAAFVGELQAHLKPDAAAVVVYARHVRPDELLSRVARYGGHVVQASVSCTDEQRLEAALAGV